MKKFLFLILLTLYLNFLLFPLWLEEEVRYDEMNFTHHTCYLLNKPCPKCRKHLLASNGQLVWCSSGEEVCDYIKPVKREKPLTK